MPRIEGNDRFIRQILSVKYKIDVYQREYKWNSDHVSLLIDDLVMKFQSVYGTTDDRGQVATYPPYFLGSFVVNVLNGERFIVDGQQRLTTLTLLLIYLKHYATQNNINITNVDNLIFSEEFGNISFNIDIPDRREIMHRIFQNDLDDIDYDGLLESQKNLLDRYQDIESMFPDEILQERELVFFIDWLIHQVIMVEIRTEDENDAYTIFETMNDRGLSLNSTDMLKGYLLTKIENRIRQEETNDLWKQKITQFIDYNSKEEINFFKNWFRAQYAQDIRPGSRGSVNRDFENIDKYHRWIRENRERDDLSLNTPEDFYHFSSDTFDFYSNTYLSILDRMYHFHPEYEIMFYNDYHTFAYQEMIILSAIRRDDTREIINKKMKLISYFIEMYIFFRKINRRTLGYSSIKYTIFNSIIKEIRNKSIDEISEILSSFIADMDEQWEGFDDYGLGSQNKSFIKFVLARITNYIERNTGNNASSVENYMNTNQAEPYQIEHLLPNTYGRYQAHFADEHEYDDYRNRIGALVLVPRRFNQSYNAMSYEDKRPEYNGQNLLARSLIDECYEHNPSFEQYFTRVDLPFQAHEHMYPEDIRQRTNLYKQICQKIWDTELFDEIINGVAAEQVE